MGQEKENMAEENRKDQYIVEIISVGERSRKELIKKVLLIKLNRGFD